MHDLPGKCIRIAAISDLHIRAASTVTLVAELAKLNGKIDLLVVAGDITDSGRLPEVEAAADTLSVVKTPMIGVLGNHDLRGLRRTTMRRTFERAGLELLDGNAIVHEVADGRRIGLAGVSGTGGGFRLDEPDEAIADRLRQVISIKARREALRLQSALANLRKAGPDITVAVTHFAPTVSTLGDEPVLKHWMLGNSLLGEIIDEDGHVDLSIHGHAHLGNPEGETTGGIPIRNVALPVTGGITIFEISPERQVHTVDTIPGTLLDVRQSETGRFRMLDLLRNE